MRRSFRFVLRVGCVLAMLNACGARTGLVASQTPFSSDDSGDDAGDTGGADTTRGQAGRANGGGVTSAGGATLGGSVGMAGTLATGGLVGVGGVGGMASAGTAGAASGGQAGVPVNEGGFGGEPAALCGNGVVEDGEECDDQNLQRGDGCSQDCRWEPVQLSLSAGSICALGANGAVKCWGSNAYGALGLGDSLDRGIKPGQMGDALPAVDLGSGRRAIAISAGYYSTCALLDDHSLKCWGSNDNGQLGQGDTNARGDEPGEMGDNLPAIDLGSGRTALAVAGGYNLTCALLDDGNVKCWGFNREGELGLGDTDSRGDEAGEMGDNLPAVQLGSGRHAKAISSLSATTVCALLDDDELKCWGFNHDGRVGLGDTINHGDMPGQMGDALPAINLGSGRTAVALSTGAYPNCALLDNASVKCWGAGGHLGTGTIGNRGASPDDMGDNLPAVDFGSGRTPTSVGAGITHVCAVFNDGALKCWGSNGFGQLGSGDTNNRGDFPSELGDTWPTVDLGTGKLVKQIVGGYANSCALLQDGSVKCWGWAGGGLGYGDTQSRGNKPGQMGDALPAVDLTF